jgi:F-type H+-transporting ATPase subunit epsilon
LNNHAPIISTLSSGDIRVITTDNKTENFTINGGVIEMQNNKIIVLAD